MRLILQLDDPALPTDWDMINPQPSVGRVQKIPDNAGRSAQPRTPRACLGNAFGSICAGAVGTGRNTTDIPMRDIVELMLAVNAQAYSFEAGNVRHEHEWKVWQDIELPDDKLLLPGVVSHATKVVEHPELVAERIIRFANLVGRERVIASTDCGLGGRVHPQIAWAKLEALVDGAALATRQLWG